MERVLMSGAASDVLDPSACRLRVKELEEQHLSFRNSVICAFNQLLDLKDINTGVHSTRLAEWAIRVAHKLNIPQDHSYQVEVAALLHDIGKIGVPDYVLCKPSRLNDEEWSLMKRHSQIGADIVGVIQQMNQVSPLIKYHHEHYDGSGYPDGLTGDQIPLGARILAVVDAYSAMTADRIYRPARPPQEARAELQRTSGSQFDPQVVSVFLQILAFRPEMVPA